MRSVSVLAVLALALPVVVPAQTGLSISNYQMVSSTPVSGTIFEETYSAMLFNSGQAWSSVSAKALSFEDNIIPVNGRDTLNFAPVPGPSVVASSNTFTVRVDRSFPVFITRMRWTYAVVGQPPVANAGLDQTARFGQTVMLSGATSANPSGQGTLTYSWAFVSAPSGSTATLANANTVSPSFVASPAGTYVVRLTVDNGFASNTDTVEINATNSAPVANAGPNQTVSLSTTVQLSGSASTDPDGNPLTYSWQFVNRPVGSTATLTNSTAVNPTFVADRAGSYLVQLTVSDSLLTNSSTVTISTQNTPPVANAGTAQFVSVGALVQLNGSTSTDVDGNPLTYAWSFNSRPAGSNATLSSSTSVNPTFTADVAGSYVVSLVVNDGQSASAPSTVTISTAAPQKPTANAGADQTVALGSLVTVAGSGTDPQSLPLTKQYSLITRPATSSAVLSVNGSGNATFTADRAGTYVVQLIVNNGTLDSDPDTVTISTVNSAPVANPGNGRVVQPGATVNLDGSASTDADGDVLTYSWSMQSRPATSNAALSGATTIAPSFTADVIGDYVIQLIVNDGKVNSAPVTMTVSAIPANSLAFSPNPLNMSTSATAVLTARLATPAPTGGITVNIQNLTAQPSVVSFPSNTVFFPAGTDTQNITVTPIAAGETNFTVFGGDFGLQPAAFTVRVTAQSLTLTADSDVVGVSNNTTGRVTLSSASANPVTVTLSASPSDKVTIPASITVPANQTTQTFTITGLATGATTLTASASGFGSSSQQMSVISTPLGQINIPANVNLTPTQTQLFPVTLAAPAPVGGVTVTLSSSNASAVTVQPSSVFISGGSFGPSNSPTVTGVATGQSTISASASGYQTANRLVTVSGTFGFVETQIAGGTGAQRTATLLLDAPAPSNGATVQLVSSNTSVASVPAAITIPAGALTGTVNITLGSAGSATITATLGAQTSSVPVLVANLGTVVLPAGTNVDVGQTVPFPVALSQPALAGGVTVNLASSDPSRLTIAPSSVFIGAGQTVPAAQPQITGVALGNALIQASGNGLTSASQQVFVSAGTSFTPPTLSINGVQTQNVVLNLAAPVPSSVTFNLISSNPAVATVPATVSASAGATAITVPITSVGSGTTTISASTAALYRSSTMEVNVFVGTFGSIISSGAINLSLGQTQSFPVAISQSSPLPVVLNLSSDNPAVGVSPTVTIAAGATTPAVLPTVTGVNFGTATINITSANYSPATRPVTVTGALSFGSNALTVSGPSTVNLSLALPAAPPAPLTVNLSSSNTAVATVPATVTFAAGNAQVNVPVTGLSVGSSTITATAANLTSATAAVSVTPASDIRLQSGVVIGPGQDQLYPITLRTAAPAGGVFVSLTSSNPAAITVAPALVFVPEGQLTSVATPRLTGLDYGTSVISASAPGLTGDSQSVLVGITVSFVQPTVTVNSVGQSAALAIQLSSPAPTGGLTINLQSSNPSVATVPASVFIPASVSIISVATQGIAPGVATVTASSAQVGSANATVTVMAPGSLVLAQNVSVPVGQYSQLAVGLASPAVNPVTITLTSANSRKIFVEPATVTIPAGATQPAIQPRVGADNIGAVEITASAPGYNPVKTTVSATSTISWDPTAISMPPNSERIVWLALTIPAPPGHTIQGRCDIVDSDFCSTTIFTRSDNPSVVRIQPEVTYYPDGSNPSVAQVVIISGEPGSTVIRASAMPYVPEVVLNVNVLGPGSIALPPSTVVTPGQTAPFPVQLSSPAPVGGVSVTLTSSDTSKVTISPSAVFIAGGATSPAAQPSVSGVDFGSASISATAPGLTGASQTVQVRGTLNLNPASLNLPSGNGSLQLTLSSPAPSPLTVSLNSSNPLVANVNSSVTIPAGATGVNVGVSAGNSGTAQITASAGANITPATANVTVGTNSTGGIGLPAPVSLTLGQSMSFPITLSAAAPSGGVTVSLTSNNAAVTVTPSVFIAGGQVSPGVQPQVTGALFGTATVSATAPNYTTSSQTVQVGGALSFASATLTVPRTTVQNLTIQLSASAPAGGVTVNLSSNNTAVATVPANVTIAAGSTQMNVPVTGVAVGTATISATSVAPNVSGASATVTVTAPDIQMPSSLSVAVGAKTSLDVSLSLPAPSGGVLFSLTSSYTNTALLSTSTVTIAQGATTPVTQPTVTGVASGTATISASVPGLVGSSTAVTVTGSSSGGGGSLSLNPASLTISGPAATQFLSVQLSSPAPIGGQTVNLSSSNTGVATVPSFVIVPFGSSSGSFAVTSVSAGSTTVTASASGLNSATSAVTVLAGSPINMPVNLSVPMSPLGNGIPYPISLGAPAPPGGVTVSLSVGVASRLAISPTSVYIAGGATQPAVQPMIRALNIGPNTVRASAPGYGSVTQNVVGTNTVQFVSPTTQTVRMGETGRLYLQLGSATPPGTTTEGRCEDPDSDFCSIAVNITTDTPGRIFVQPQFVYYPDGSNPPIGLVVFQPVSVGTVKIKVGNLPYIPEVTLDVTITP